MDLGRASTLPGMYRLGIHAMDASCCFQRVRRDQAGARAAPNRTGAAQVQSVADQGSTTWDPSPWSTRSSGPSPTTV